MGCISSSRGSSRPRDRTHIPCVSCIGRSILYRYATWEAPLCSVSSVQFRCSVMSDSVTPWTAACQASPSITNSWSLLKLMSIESVMPSNHLILSRPFLLPPSIIPRIKIFSNESVLRIRWPRERQLRYPRKGNKISRLDTKLVMNHRAINSKLD